MMEWIFLWLLCVAQVPEEVAQVENGLKPKGPELRLELVEDLRIDSSTHEAYGLWPGPYVSFAVSPAGNLLVGDDRENHIVVFDADGQFVRTIGGPGQGPGEFQRLKGIQFLADGRLVAFDSGGIFSLSIFDRDLNFVSKSTPRLAFNLNTHSFDPAGRYAWGNAVSLDQQSGRMIKSLKLMDGDHHPIQDVFAVDVMSFNGARATEPAFWAEFIGDQLKQVARGLTGFAAFDGQGRVWTAEGHKYEVSLWQLEGMRKLRVLTREYKPIPRNEEETMSQVTSIKDQLNAQLPAAMAAVITPGVIQESIRFAKYTPAKPPIFGLVSMEDGKLLVVHDSNSLTRWEQGDLFDADGHYRGQIRHPNLGLLRMVFTQGFAFTIETDEDDENSLVRYRLAWK